MRKARDKSRRGETNTKTNPGNAYYQAAIQKNIHEVCIISEKNNTVWKHPCYHVSKYKTSTNNLLQCNKRSPFSLSFLIFSLSFQNGLKFQSLEVKGWQSFSEFKIFFSWFFSYSWRSCKHASLVEEGPGGGGGRWWSAGVGVFLGQGRERLRVVHIGNRHSARLRGKAR